ncbi:MAG: DNA-protecting protein DprA [Planctomycetes bacterium]|nr:DNA-protecting protein DprA [Planctomycetota bacterium]
MHQRYVMLALAEGLDEAPVAALLQPDLDPAAVLAAPPSPPAVPPRVARRLRAPDLAAEAAAVLAATAAAGQQLLAPDELPAAMRQAPLRPLCLFVRGDITAIHRSPAVAFVGSRTPTPYGVDAARELAAALARAGAILWSGLARGVDAIAHEACVAAGAPTVAVLAGGLDAIYPPEHEDLAARIVATGGCLLSELPPGHRARRGHFVRRNRILAMGVNAVVVVEASLASGALHTARSSAQLGADVYALPGPWRSERSQGCHRLLTEGALVLESAEALLQGLGLRAGATPDEALRFAASAEEERLLQALARGPRPTDLLARECALPRAAFLRALFALEHRGALQRLPGDLWRRGEGLTSR